MDNFYTWKLFLALWHFILDNYFLVGPELPEKKPRNTDEDHEEADTTQTNYEEWKRRILENAAKANSWPLDFRFPKGLSVVFVLAFGASMIGTWRFCLLIWLHKNSSSDPLVAMQAIVISDLVSFKDRFGNSVKILIQPSCVIFLTFVL